MKKCAKSNNCYDLLKFYVVCIQRIYSSVIVYSYIYRKHNEPLNYFVAYLRMGFKTFIVRNSQSTVTFHKS